MQFHVVAVYDRRAEVYSQTTSVQNLIAAMRSFEHHINGGDQTMTDSPNDFELRQVAVWDDQTCEFENINHITLLRGIDAVKGSPPAIPDELRTEPPIPMVPDPRQMHAGEKVSLTEPQAE